MSYSYSSGPPSSNMYQRSSSIINETETDQYNDPDPAPTRSNVALRNNDEPESYTQGQRTLNDYSYHGQTTHGPSFTDMQHIVVRSNPGGTGSFVNNTGAPDIDGHVRINYSNTTHDISYQEKSVPGISRQVHDNRSNPGVVDDNVPVNQADYVGISLVGRKFKEVNPTAYYVEKNESQFF